MTDKKMDKWIRKKFWKQVKVHERAKKLPKDNNLIFYTGGCIAAYQEVLDKLKKREKRKGVKQ